MPTEVIMPKVDMDMSTGKIAAWHVSEGGQVAKGDALFDMETDKAAMEVDAPASGTLHHVLPAGSVVPIGDVVGWLYAAGEVPGDAPARGSGRAASARSAPEAVEPPASPALAEASRPGAVGVRATPRARALAREAGINLAAFAGSGPRGRVQARDLADRVTARDTDLPEASAPIAAVASADGPTESQAGFRIIRSVAGTGVPVVLVHGFASDAASWAEVEPYLGSHPVLRVEVPAHGKSAGPAPDGFTGLTAAFRRAFDALDLDVAHFVGHSLGGALCLALADTRPRTVASLTLVAPAGLGPEIDGDTVFGICRATRPESLAPWLRRLFGNPDRVTDGYVQSVMTSRSNPDLRREQMAMADALFPDGVQGFDLRAALGRVRAPSRIVWGKRDAIIPWRHALSAKGETALHLFEGVGHMMPVEAPETLGRLIADRL